MISTVTQEQFLSSDEIDQLVELIESNNPAVAYIDEDGVWKDKGLVANLHGWTWTDPKMLLVKQKLEMALQPWLGEFVVEKAHLLDAQLPWAVHNDYEIRCSELSTPPQAVVIIPIEDADSNTIVFHQGAPYSEFKRYREENPPLREHIPGKIWNQYLSHCWKKDQFWLTIDRLFPWKKGALCLFDRQTWHASDSFHTHIHSKRAIVLFTNWVA